VIIAGTRSSTFAAPSAAAVGCALYFDFDHLLAPRAPSEGAASTPLISARKRLGRH
jgi:hypothetical protein